MMLAPFLLLTGAAPGNGVAQAVLNDCAAAHFRQADAALNAQWRRTRSLFAAHGRGTALLASQRAWLAYRDAQCAAENAESEGGSIHGMAVAECKARLTTDRTTTLERMGRE